MVPIIQVLFLLHKVECSCVLNGIFYFGNNYESWKLHTAKTRVGLGRTEVSVRLNCIVFSARSFGHGLRNPGSQWFFKRLDFHAFLHVFDFGNNHND